MRINIYQEEVTADCAVVVKHNVAGHGDEPVTFYGARVYLASPDALHQTPDDDDRSAITFWFTAATAQGIHTVLADLALQIYRQFVDPPVTVALGNGHS